MNIVEVQSVCKSFGDVHAVDRLDVTVPAGRIYGFLGPNGAGKTTTIRMLMNIIRPDSGSIHIFEDAEIEKIKHRIGYMPEERGLYRKMNVRDTLKYFGSIKSVNPRQLPSRIEKWLETVELTSWADKRVEELSRGMHQKLQFAVTVINDPELLILDEPFSGLDPVNQEMLKGILSKMRSGGKTIIFSTHMMHEAEQLCDDVLMVNNGRAVLNGNLQQIKQQYRPNSVRLGVKGDISFLSDIEIVKSMKNENGYIDVRLLEGSNPQELLKLLVSKVIVKKFELKLPTLHEIFLELAGGNNE